MSDDRRQDHQASIFDMSFDEALAEFARGELGEMDQALEAMRRKEKEVERYIDERRDSIRRGARRAPKRFRL